MGHTDQIRLSASSSSGPLTAGGGRLALYLFFGTYRSLCQSFRAKAGLHKAVVKKLFVFCWGLLGFLVEHAGTRATFVKCFIARRKTPKIDFKLFAGYSFLKTISYIGERPWMIKKDHPRFPTNCTAKNVVFQTKHEMSAQQPLMLLPHCVIEQILSWTLELKNVVNWRRKLLKLSEYGRLAVEA